MNSANAFIRPRRLGLAAPFVFLLLAGCGDYSAYPEEVRYPLRTDPILQKPSEKEFVYPDPPGRLDEFLADRGRDDAKLLDPKTIPAVDPVKFHFTDDVRSALRADGVPDDVLAQLDALKGKEFTSRRQFSDELGKVLNEGDALSKYRAMILERAAKQPMDQATLRKALLEIFGTPAGPRVALPEGEDSAVFAEQIEHLKLDTATLAEGSKLYRRYCMQCHGISGDGRGPTGPWVHPHPRDYRQGIFKFMSTAERKPRRDDLFRTIKSGVDGTSMPSFALLGDKALEELVSYVIHLSIRGEVELNLCKPLCKDGVGQAPDNLFEGARALTADFVKYWYDSDKKPFMTPTKPPADDLSDSQRRESVARGYKYFVGTEGACIKCHIDFGRQVRYVSDDWGTLVRPRNLTEENYRGGRRPIDLYWRIRGGIRGTKMAAGAGLMAGEDDTKVWDVVNFVEALPYPPMLPVHVREQVYGKREESPHTVAEK